MKSFVVDVNHCSGCYNCQMSCKDEHCGNDWTPFAKPQPDTGQFWLKIHEFERGSTPKVKKSYVPVMCQHCDDAPCISACPVEAIYRRDDGLVLIDPIKCTGCRNCLDTNACPYEKIYFNEQFAIAQKCTGCAHILDRGWPIKEPRCCDVCHNEAIKFGEESELSSLISDSEKWRPELGLTPRVHYLGLPKKFIAGAVFDSKNQEAIIGATCTLSGASNGSTTTDAFGDFWFEDLGEGEFSLKIEASGYTAKNIDSISTVEKDVNLGDIDIS